MEVGRAPWMALLIAAIVLSFNDQAATADDQPAGGPLETNVLCVSKCGTCPTVCSSSPPPPASTGASGYSSSSPPYSSTPAPSPPGLQPKGRRPSNYYYFFTAGGGQSCTASNVYTLMLLAFLPLVAV